jgi:aminopeptidase N
MLSPAFPIGLAAWLAAFAQSPAAQDPEPGAGFDVERYAVAMTPDVATRSVSGTEEITLRSTSPALLRLPFSPNGFAIDQATADGRPVRVVSTAERLVFELPAPLRANARTVLRFRFRGTPSRGITAAGETMYSSYFACNWMTCLQDAPGDKALFALELRLPARTDSLSIGEMTRAGPAADGTVRHVWRTSRPYSPYLFSFAVGRFARAVGRSGPVRLVYLGHESSEAELRRLFAETPAILRFMADRAGIGLPGNRYTQLLVPGNEAQEAATFSLIGRAELDRAAAEPQAGWVVAHELAHQFWGNLVTASTWRDFWLNEGIATFMTAAYKEHRYGPDAYRAELDGARRRLARAREMGWDRPLAFAGPYPSLPVRRAVQYSKGALFMDHLRQLLGEDAFWRGLRTYTRRHAGGTVTSADFQRAMERASGRDLSAAFREWVFGEAGAGGSEALRR